MIAWSHGPTDMRVDYEMEGEGSDECDGDGGARGG